LFPNAEVECHEVLVKHQQVDNADNYDALGVLDAKFIVCACLDVAVASSE